MKNFFKNRYIIFIIISLICGVLITTGVINIKLDSSIRSLFPYDKNLDLNMKLQEITPHADKVILYVEVNDEKNLKQKISEIENIIKEYPVEFTNQVPGQEDILDLIKYTEENSLLLYPYESSENPFTSDQIKKRIKQKENYLFSLPFMEPDQSFFLDPLMMGFEIIKNADKSYNGRFSPKYNGIIAENNKSYIKIMKSGFLTEDYKKIKLLHKIDKRLEKYSRENGIKTFLFSIHLFYHEGRSTTINEVTIIFIVTLLLVTLIFLFFFKDISLSLFSFLPVGVGFAITFILISVFKKKFGGIALGFGATTSGIAIDYTIHYLTKRNYYSTLNEVRKKIGFSLLLGLITTIAAFVFLPFSRIMSLIEIAIFGILTISFAFIFSWFILQKMIPPQKIDDKIRTINFKIFGKTGFIIITIFTFLLLIFIPFVRFEDNIHNLDMKHNKLSKRADIIKSMFKESSAGIYLTFKGKNREEILKKTTQAFDIIDRKNPDLVFFSPHLLIPSNESIIIRKNFIKQNFNKKEFLDNLNKSQFSIESFNQWLYMIENIDTGTITNLPLFIEKEIESMFIKINDIEYFLIPINDKKISGKIKQILKKNKIDFFIIDMVEDTKNGLLNFEKNALFFLLISIFIIFIILLIFYRNILHAFTSIFPGITALLACLAISVITRHKFNMMHFVSCVLLLGIGVDYGIFITGAFRDNFNTDEINLTFQAIFISTLTTLAGFAVLSFSRNHSMFSLGTGMFAGIVSSFLTAYMGLPFLLKTSINLKK